MRFLLDTNILLHYVRGDNLARFIEAIYGLLTSLDSPLVSVVTVGEIRALARELGWGQAKRQELEHLLRLFEQVPLPFGSVLDDYVDISEFCRQNGRVLSKNDLWIAATARATGATGATLLTTDKDFLPLDPLLLACIWINPAP